MIASPGTADEVVDLECRTKPAFGVHGTRLEIDCELVAVVRLALSRKLGDRVFVQGHAKNARLYRVVIKDIRERRGDDRAETVFGERPRSMFA